MPPATKLVAIQDAPVPMRLSNHWSAQPAALGQTQGYRHFALLGQRGRGAERAAELQAVLAPGFRLVVPLAELGNRQLWQPGWQQL